MENKFYMVWSSISGYSYMRHSTKLSAITEAERLAKEEIGQKFYVLEALSVSVIEPPVVTTELDGLLF